MLTCLDREILRCREGEKGRAAGLKLQEAKLRVNLTAQFIYSAQGIGARKSRGVSMLRARQTATILDWRPTASHVLPC